MPSRDVAERFFSHVEKTPACWIWVGCRDRNGYGRFEWGTKREGTLRSMEAHRVAFFLLYGRWPTPFGLHDCDNPPCVRVGKGHVVEGTPKKNAEDRVARGHQSYTISN